MHRTRTPLAEKAGRDEGKNYMKTLNVSQYNNLSSMFLPHLPVGMKPTAEDWEAYAKKNFCVILGMVMANNSTSEQLKELATEIKKLTDSTPPADMKEKA